MPTARFERKYTHERLQAVYKARFEWGWSYREIEKKARAGRLVLDDPFEADWQYVGRLCRDEEKKRLGRFNSPLAEKPHRDAIEEMRRACISIADDLLTNLRGISRKYPERVDPKRLTEAIRAVTLAASIPARNEEAPAAPGQVKDGRQASGGRPSGKTGALLKAMRDGPQNAEGPRNGGPSD